MNQSPSHYDAVIVGARVAGASTAMLLARAGLDVLVVDRSAPGSDTLSSHALMRQAVSQLNRWGVVPAIIDAGTPVIRRTVFAYPDHEVSVDIRPEGDAEGLYAPRRTVLDPILVDAARAAGAEVHHDTALLSLVRNESGRVGGVHLRDAFGRERTVLADLVIGADGLHSKVAREVDAPVIRRGRAANAVVMRYLSGCDLVDDEYRWINRPTRLGGVIPTNDGVHCLFSSLSQAEFATARHDVESLFWRGLRELDPAVADAARGGDGAGPFRTFPGHLGQFRQAVGDGWALVGDAGYFKDPAAAHGISDALRDAELLADAIVDGDLRTYGPTRDRLSAGLFDALESIVDWSWTIDELPERHFRMGKAMSVEHRAVLEHFAAEDAPVAAA
ncbi:MAG: NAD(P)/FAD-dependent oxidoreductase [Acidimicrobiales bacterium]|nr:NAD(P)/FAD-dependent oxidoreductase [Acidimicrobiales bacterium]